MTNRQILTSAGIVLFAMLLSPVVAEDALDRRMRALGPDAQDCGRTDRSAPNRAKVLECVESQVQAGTPFRVRFDDTCIDAICMWGLLREKPEGQLRLVPYDPQACTPGNDTDPWCGTFAVVPCKNPRASVRGKSLQLDCEDYVF